MTMSAEPAIGALHSVESSEWYTPPDILDAAREALGGDFDLDPASCAFANKNVRARSIYEAGHPRDDGLSLYNRWAGRVWLNPPSPPKLWWQRLISVRKDVAAVYLAYSIEQVQQSQGWTPGASMLSFPLCVPKSRVRYLCTARDAALALRRTIERRRSKGKGDATAAETRRLAELDAMDPVELVRGDAPTHSSAVVGVGVDGARFRRALKAIGEVCGG